jgi:hypothetical protein
MHHFISMMLHYILIHIIETSWSRFHDQWDHIQDLDMYHQCHQAYLNTILTNSFFPGGDSAPLLQGRLNAIMQNIHQFDSMQTEFCSCFVAEGQRSSDVQAILGRVRNELATCLDVFQRNLEQFKVEIKGLGLEYGYLISLLAYNR